MAEFRGSDKEIYQSCISRIADLNRAQFNYRLLYVSLIAGFFTALTFFRSIAEGTSIIRELDAYLLLVVAIGLAALIGIFVLSLFDAMHQELLEHCVYSAECIEYTNEIFTGRRIFARPSGSLISVLLNSAIFLFYAVPGAIIFGLIHFVFSVSRIEELGMIYPAVVDALCPEIEVFNQEVGGIANIVIDPSCVQDLEGHSVSGSIAEIIEVGYFAAVGFGGFFLLVHFHRIGGRLLKLLWRPDYPIVSVRHQPVANHGGFRGVFDLLIGWATVIWVLGSVAYLSYRSLLLVL